MQFSNFFVQKVLNYLRDRHINLDNRLIQSELKAFCQLSAVLASEVVQLRIVEQQNKRHTFLHEIIYPFMYMKLWN